MKTVAKKKTKAIKPEGILICLIFLVILAIPVAKVYTKARLSETNIELERVKNSIEDQENLNDSLKMEISELSSLDKIQIVAAANGLSYQNGNIKVVTNE
ncbi:MAG: cell division protein FtsL [Candidatus Coprovivens sp.]